MVIMSILLILAVVNVRSTQVKARDSERISDTTSIAQSLESYYQADHESLSRTYPGVGELGSGSPALAYVASHLHEGSLRAPGLPEEAPTSLVMATNAVSTPAGVAPQPTTTTYVYQPLTRDNTLCETSSTTRCRSFAIFYQLEQPSPECGNSTTCVVRSTAQ